MNVMQVFLGMLYFTSYFFLCSNFWTNEANRPGNAPTHCGIEKYNNSFLAKYPQLKPGNNQAYKTLQKHQNGKRKHSSTSYTIPVVVHIVHDNGVENISDAAVLSGIEDLNNGMRGTTQNNQFIHNNFEQLKAGTQIEFVLAKFDPQGNSTNGIIRHQNRTFTLNGNDEEMRLQYHWPRNMYLNLYIVKRPFIDDDSSGFGTYPYLVDDLQLAHLDGIVLAYWAFGRHSYLYNEWYYIVTHEVGHWLNLYHIWGENEQSCNDDDQVADTPNTTGNVYAERSACNTISFKCNSLDNITNFMDYASPCHAMFTQNQKERMQLALNSTVAERNNLHSPQNLELTLGITANEEFCEDVILKLSNSIITENIAANTSIITNGIVTQSYSISINAGQSIRFTDGFKIEAGASFEAYIEPCSAGNP